MPYFQCRVSERFARLITKKEGDVIKPFVMEEGPKQGRYLAAF